MHTCGQQGQPPCHGPDFWATTDLEFVAFAHRLWVGKGKQTRLSIHDRYKKVWLTKFSGEPPIFPDGSPKDFSTSTTYPWDTCPPWYNTFLQSASPVTPPTAPQGKDEEALAAQLKDDLKLSSEMRKRVAQHLLSHQYTGFDSRGRPHIPGGLVPGCADLIRSFGRADSEQKNKLKVLFIIGQEHRAQEVGSPEAYFRSRPTAKADFDPILAAEPRAMCLENTRKVPSSDKRRQSSLMLAYIMGGVDYTANFAYEILQ